MSAMPGIRSEFLFRHGLIQPLFMQHRRGTSLHGSTDIRDFISEAL